MQTTNLVPGYGAEAVFSDSTEFLIPFASRCEMIVEHRQHKRPVDVLERLSQLVEVSEEVAFNSPSSAHAQELEQVENLSRVDLHRSSGQEQQTSGFVA